MVKKAEPMTVRGELKEWGKLLWGETKAWGDAARTVGNEFGVSAVQVGGELLTGSAPSEKKIREYINVQLPKK